MPHKLQGRDSPSFVLSPHMCTQAAGWKSIAFKSKSMQKWMANKPGVAKTTASFSQTWWLPCNGNSALAFSLIRIFFGIIQGSGGWKQPSGRKGQPDVFSPSTFTFPNNTAAMSCIRMEKELRFDHFSPRLNVQLNTSSISCEGAHRAWTLCFSHLDAFIINIQKASLLCNTPRWAVHVDIIVLGSGSASWFVIGYTLIVRQTRIYPRMWATAVAPIWGSIHGKRNSLSTHHFNPRDVKCAINNTWCRKGSYIISMCWENMALQSSV